MQKRYKHMYSLKNIVKTIIALALSLLVPLVSLIYGLINKPHGDVRILVTFIDRSIPFVKEFILPYVSWYFFIYSSLIILCLFDRKNYYRTLTAYIITLLTSFLIFMLFQTTVPRPVVTGDDIFSRLVRMIYTNDKPFNCLPSIHVSTSYLIMRAVNISAIKNRAYRMFIYTLGLLIILSTLFVKQHVILDIAAGIALAELAYRFVNSLSDRFVQNLQHRSMQHNVEMEKHKAV
jgi:membrane-associated phospholipid phosphatase